MPATPPFLRKLEENWLQIREEFRAVQRDLVQWHEEDLNPNGGWQVYPIYGWPEGESIDGFTERVPFTAKLVRSLIPMHGAVGFSRLRAGHVIPPHEGLQLNFLRCHLGLDVPQGDIGMDVAGETFRWQEGKAFVFDDRKLHHVWNRTSQDRIILIIDFIP